jgi:hypothetical protein
MRFGQGRRNLPIPVVLAKRGHFRAKWKGSCLQISESLPKTSDNLKKRREVLHDGMNKIDPFLPINLAKWQKLNRFTLLFSI